MVLPRVIYASPGSRSKKETKERSAADSHISVAVNGEDMQRGSGKPGGQKKEELWGLGRDGREGSGSFGMEVTVYRRRANRHSELLKSQVTEIYFEVGNYHKWLRRNEERGDAVWRWQGM